MLGSSLPTFYTLFTNTCAILVLMQSKLAVVWYFWSIGRVGVLHRITLYYIIFYIISWHPANVTISCHARSHHSWSYCINFILYLVYYLYVTKSHSNTPRQASPPTSHTKCNVSNLVQGTYILRLCSGLVSWWNESWHTPHRQSYLFTLELI